MTPFSVRDLQARLAALGFSPGPIDGILGKRTTAAAAEARLKRRVGNNQGLFHPSGLHRIHGHWTGGGDGVNAIELSSYNFIIDRDGQVVPGLFPPEAQANLKIGGYAAHTLNANTSAIGVAIDAMADARERPFSWGTSPMKWTQVHAYARLTATLCRSYDIPVSRYSTLTHAEVQPTLGVKQNRKWDIMVLPDMDAPGDPIEVGDRLRTLIADCMESDEWRNGTPEVAVPAPPADPEDPDEPPMSADEKLALIAEALEVIVKVVNS